MTRAFAVSAELTLSLIILSLFFSCGRQQQSQAKSTGADSPPPEIACLGRIVVEDGAVKVAAPAQTIVLELRVQRGSMVRPGDIVAVLQNYSILKAAVKEAESQVAVAESALTQVKIPEKNANIAAQKAAIERQQLIVDHNEVDYQRKKQLHGEHLVPTTDLQLADINLKTAQRDLRREGNLLAGLQEVRGVDVDLATKKLAAAAATLDRALADLDGTLVRAPRAGTVLEIYAREGEAVGPDQRILDLGNTAHMFVEAEVYANDFPRVHEGAKASITGQAFAGTLTGTVVEILRQAGTSTLVPVDPLTSTDKRVIRVRIRLHPGPDIMRLSGSQVDVRIEPVLSGL